MSCEKITVTVVPAFHKANIYKVIKGTSAREVNKKQVK